VIRAVDAGHVNHGDLCVKCSLDDGSKVAFPCQVIRIARKVQPRYAEDLARVQAIAAGRLSVQT